MECIPRRHEEFLPWIWRSPHQNLGGFLDVMGQRCAAGDSWSLEKFDFMLSMGVDCSVEMPHSRWSNPTSHSNFKGFKFYLECWYPDKV